jgi:tetratricopeptide (TPR) repeat protein
VRGVTRQEEIEGYWNKDSTRYFNGYEASYLKYGLNKDGGFFTGHCMWTSTLDGKGNAWVLCDVFELSPLSWHLMRSALCVRPMEPELLQTAKAAAAVDHPVPDIQTLQTFIPLNKSRLAYQAGKYQESIAQAQIAISLKASPAIAYWGIGISYGRLGQWDQAIANLQTALSIDKNNSDAKTALKWAKDGQKTAKKGKQPKEPNPRWK